MAKISLYLDSRKANAEGKYPLAIHLFQRGKAQGKTMRTTRSCRLFQATLGARPLNPTFAKVDAERNRN